MRTSQGAVVASPMLKKHAEESIQVWPRTCFYLQRGISWMMRSQKNPIARTPQISDALTPKRKEAQKIMLLGSMAFRNEA